MAATCPPPPPHFWKGLAKEHIRIPDLTLVIGTDPAPLHYLRSNKGMVRLVLCTGLKDFRGDYEQVERTGKAFFKDVLLLLSGTLEELHMKPRMRGKWGYGGHAADSIAQCKQLKALGIHVSDHDSMVRVYFRFFHFNSNANPLTVDIFFRLRQSVARFAYVVKFPLLRIPTSSSHRALEQFRIGDTKGQDVLLNLDVILPHGVVYRPELMIDGEKPSWFFKRLQCNDPS
ncbi:hypothetical protein IW262DRAFT_1460270 [Armillaria fumosa]|nr:hypothetical protein IW262DRAFT_1460270 [Armillaria fumosa]